MNESPTAEDRRHVRTSLIVTLAVFFTLFMGTLDRVSAQDRQFLDQVDPAGASEPAAESIPTVTPAVSAAPGAADESQNTMVGCGCAEGCLSGS